MEPSGYCGVKIFGFGRLLCVLSVLVSLSRGNVLISPGEGMISLRFIAEVKPLNHALNNFKCVAQIQNVVKITTVIFSKLFQKPGKNKITNLLQLHIYVENNGDVWIC